MKSRESLTLLLFALLLSVGTLANPDQVAAAGQRKANAAGQPTPAKSGLAANEAPNAQASDEVEFQRITVEQLKEKIAKNEPVTIIDARSDGSYNESDKQIKGAIRLTVDDIQAHIKELPRDREIVAYCTCPTEHTSGRAAQILMANGFTKVLALKGGWDAWVKDGGQVEPKKK